MKILKYAAIIAATIMLFLLARNHAILERGNTRIGGEILIFFLPLLLKGFKEVKQ